MTLAGVLTTAVLLMAHTAGASVTRVQYLMGTLCQITAGTSREIDRAFAEARRVEAMLSTWREDSELIRVNHGEQPGPELGALLRTALQWRDRTGGAFDPCIRSLIDVWQIRSSGGVPSPTEVVAAMEQARHSRQYEEGAFGKGYAIDRMLAQLHGDVSINFGGQLFSRASTSVTIADPLRRDHAVIAFRIANSSLSTSSGSEHTFVVKQRHFSHILDPRTGQALPPRGSVSVVHESALIADMLSTALYVMGTEEGLRWARAHEITAVFIDEQKVIRMSAPLTEPALLDPTFRIED